MACFYVPCRYNADLLLYLLLLFLMERFLFFFALRCGGSLGVSWLRRNANAGLVGNNVLDTTFLYKVLKRTYFTHTYSV